MAKIFDRLTDKKSRDMKVLSNFVALFCREQHRSEAKEAFPVLDEKLRQVLGEQELLLCPECTRLLSHGIAKLLLCKHDPKPMCKKCTTQCYAPGYREKMREVMRFSGLYLIKHGRVDLMAHYFL